MKIMFPLVLLVALVAAGCGLIQITIGRPTAVQPAPSPRVICPPSLGVFLERGGHYTLLSGVSGDLDAGYAYAYSDEYGSRLVIYPEVQSYLTHIVFVAQGHRAVAFILIPLTGCSGAFEVQPRNGYVRGERYAFFYSIWMSNPVYYFRFP